MHVIALAQQKGGVLKSTLAVHLAAEALRSGSAAVVLEVDKQGTTTLWTSLREGRPPDVQRIESIALPRALGALAQRGARYAFLDLPGAHNTGIMPAIRAADFVLVPSRPNLVDIAASAETVAACGRLNKPYAYILTVVPPSGGRADEAREALEAEGHLVAPGGIGDRKVFEDAMAAGQTVFEREPSGKGAAEVSALWSFVQMQLEKQHGKVA